MRINRTKKNCVNRFERRLKAKLERQKNKQATNPPNQTAQKEQLQNRKA